MFVLLGICLTARSGEKLQIQGAKSQAQPVLENRNRPSDTAFPSLNSPNVLSGILPPKATAKGKESSLEKRMRLERIERKNWAILEPGELQDADMGSFEKPGYRLEDLEKKDEQSEDYTFYGLGNGKDQRQDENGYQGSSSRSSTRGQRQSTSKTANGQALQSESEDSESDSARNQDSPQKTESSGLASHISPAFQPKAGLGSGRSASGGFQALRRNDAGLNPSVSSATSHAMDVELNRRNENFRQLLNSPSSSRQESSLLTGPNASRLVPQGSLNPGAGFSSAASPAKPPSQAFQNPTLAAPQSSLFERPQLGSGSPTAPNPFTRSPVFAPPPTLELKPSPLHDPPRRRF